MGMTDFDMFWSLYPRRVGKLAALRAYQKALSVSSSEEILAGVEEYRKHLPDDVQYIAHPATFLNQGRWMDEYTAPEKAKPKTAAYQEYVPLKFRRQA